MQNILNNIGQFSEADVLLFERYASKRSLSKNEFLLREGQVCKSLHYILSGAFYEFQNKEIDETIIDLRIQNDWVINQQSLTMQTPSKTSIKAFTSSEIIELSLSGLHGLIAQSQAFLQFGKILNQAGDRVNLYDNTLSPTEKYEYIKEAKPLLLQMFPLKMIASYLKITPETLSRVRANY